MEPARRRHLLGEGDTDHTLSLAVRDGVLARIRHGSYAGADEWDGAHTVPRLVALARSAADAAKKPPVFSHVTAAALHGLPLFDCRETRTHVLSTARGRTSGSGPVIRHRDQWDGRHVRIGDLLVTSLARTVFDIARTAPPTTAIGCADAALRRAAAIRGTRELDHDAAERLREEIRDLIDEHRGAPGVHQARSIVGFADPRAESVGESVSRLHLRDLGFRDIALQVPVALPGGGRAVVDLEVDGVLCEFDGFQKYLDRAMRGERTAAQVIEDEKRREDRIRAATDQRLVRWTMKDISSRQTFAAVLRGYGLLPGG